MSAFLTVDNIVCSWLLRRGKSLHSYWKAMPLAAEAVRELSLTSMPMINHKLLTKSDGEQWFALPADFSDWVSVGVRQGGSYFRLSTADDLMPYRNNDTGGDMLAGDFADDLNVSGAYTSWSGPALPGSVIFNPAQFGSSFQTSNPTNAVVPAPHSIPLGLAVNRYRIDTVTVNPREGIIMVPGGFTGNELYLVYVGIGSVDTMTYIPVKAQAAIEAYIDWKYTQNKRNGIREGGAFKMLFDEQHRLLRARNNDLTTAKIINIMNRKFGFSKGINTGTGNSATPSATASTIPVSTGFPLIIPFALS